MRVSQEGSVSPVYTTTETGTFSSQYTLEAVLPSCRFQRKVCCRVDDQEKTQRNVSVSTTECCRVNRAVFWGVAGNHLWIQHSTRYTLNHESSYGPFLPTQLDSTGFLGFSVTYWYQPLCVYQVGFQPSRVELKMQHQKTAGH
ncbi:hypothetical protein ATANTOWER_019198 [Ataeniobius toweri]|uniref:Uncharacterized protein n=1 Tax=Ataeniobius toweri TaxID=208326 RepID=A0ABU7AG15_9TELE|nr:hypothetical protein [Ataeniobius toweri]